MSIGLIFSATLTPSSDAFRYAISGMDAPDYHTSCDVSRTGPAPLELLTSIDDTSLNVLLFVPLGIVVALLPRSRRTAALVVAAVALPLGIEAIQLIVPQLDRACQTADIADNLTGLVSGLTLGAAARLLARIDEG